MPVGIHGKGGCPHTSRARGVLSGAQCVDALADTAALERMLALTRGVRRGT